MFVCGNCGTSFTRLDNLQRHKIRVVCKRKSDESAESSNGAPPSKKNKSDIDSHSVASTSTDIYCTYCKVSVPKNRMAAHVRTLLHRTNSSTTVGGGVKLVQSAFKNRICSYRISSSDSHTDLKLFFSDIKSSVLNVLEEMASIHRTLKVHMEVFASYYLETQEISSIKSFNTPNKIVDEGCDITEIYEEMVSVMVSKSSEFDEKDSGMLKYTSICFM